MQSPVVKNCFTVGGFQCTPSLLTRKCSAGSEGIWLVFFMVRLFKCSIITCSYSGIVWAKFIKWKNTSILGSLLSATLQTLCSLVMAAILNLCWRLLDPEKKVLSFGFNITVAFSISLAPGKLSNQGVDILIIPVNGWHFQVCLKNVFQVQSLLGRVLPLLFVLHQSLSSK